LVAWSIHVHAVLSPGGEKVLMPGKLAEDPTAELRKKCAFSAREVWKLLFLRVIAENGVTKEFIS
jgi:hypothetical protein